MQPEQKGKTLIAEDIEIVGSVKCESDIHIDGKLNGDLTATGKVSIGASATVKGNISVECITVMGQVNGNITAKDRIELKSTARLNGDIRARRLTVEDGVSFVGKSEVNPAGSPARQAPAAEQRSSAAEEADAQNVAEESGRKGGMFRK